MYDEKLVLDHPQNLLSIALEENKTETNEEINESIYNEEKDEGMVEDIDEKQINEEIISEKDE